MGFGYSTGLCGTFGSSFGCEGLEGFSSGLEPPGTLSLLFSLFYLFFLSSFLSLFYYFDDF